MRASRPLLLTLVALVFAVAAGCSGGSGGYDDDDDDGGDDDDDGAVADIVISGSDYDAHDGFRASMRLFSGTTVMFCGSSGVISGGSFSITAPDMPWGSYTAELIAHAGVANTTFEEATDHNWLLTLGTVEDLSLSETTWPDANGESGISWAEGTACPGE